MYFSQSVFKGVNLSYMACNNSILWDVYKPFSFQLGMMNHDRYHYTLQFQMFDTSLMTLTFIQGHKVTRKLEMVLLFCCKVAWRIQSPCDGCFFVGNKGKEVM